MLTWGGLLLDATLAPEIWRLAATQLWLANRPRRLRAAERAVRDTFAARVLTKSPIAAHRAASRGGFADVCALPMVEKHELRDAAADYARAHDVSRLYRARTTGSTGQPLEVYFGRDYYVRHYGRWAFFLATNGVWPTPGSVVSVHLAGGKDVRPWSVVQPALALARSSLVNVHRANWPSPAALAEHVAGLNPGLLYGTPTTLLELAAAFESAPRAAHGRSPKLLVSGAEALYDSHRRRLESLFGAEVRCVYGLTEVGGILGEECRAHAGYHVNSLDYHVEAVDAAGRSVPDGEEGELVVTNLYSDVVPICRYRTGDFGVLSSEPCACGLAFPRIVRLSGRQLTRFTLPDGRSINPYMEFQRHLFAMPFSRFQLVQERIGRISLTYTALDDLAGDPRLEELAAAVRQVFGEHTEFVAARVAEFEVKGKFHCFVNRLATTPT
jgi:phenylacetate-CoA ligase